MEMKIQGVTKKYSKIEIELLLQHILGKSREFLYINPECRLTRNQLRKLTWMIKRREKGEPVAYILGYKYFHGLKFEVNENVLIPRPETEELVNKAYQAYKVNKATKPIKILDVGTGSGNIIISLAKLLSTKRSELKAKYYASDISPAALKVAKENARPHKVKVKFIQSDLFSKIIWSFDIIIANLPYVTFSDYEKLKNNLKYEPKKALTDNTNKWLLCEKFFEQVAKHLNPMAMMLLEIDPQAKPLLLKLAKKYLPEAAIKFYKDLQNLYRYLIIQV